MTAPTLGQEYLTEIADAITKHPRSLQRNIGPSELGHKCARRVGYKLAQHPERPSGAPNWKATVGTAMHAWLESVFDQYNLAHAAETCACGHHQSAHMVDGGRCVCGCLELAPGHERFLIESKVSVGEVGGREITGSCDLFDKATGVVTDWKTTGPTQLKSYRAKGPGEQYRAQAHLYGRGWQRKGYRVEGVQIVFLPRNGELAEAYVWGEVYDESVALAALGRADAIATGLEVFGPAAFDRLPTADAWCQLCPYFLAGSDNAAQGCPGDPGSKVRNVPAKGTDPFS